MINKLPILKKIHEWRTLANEYRAILKTKQTEENKIYKEFKLFEQQAAEPRFDLNWNNRLAITTDRTANTGFDRHYVYHTAWAARKVKETNPVLHIDISSYLYFSTLVSAFVPIDFYDYRPANISLNNLQSKHADLTKLSFADNSILSLSCMHTIEHIGLGRYGDNLDYDGDIKAINELQRVLAPNGNLFFVVPIGKPSIVFNAHRIYSYEQIKSYFNNLTIVEFTLIPENETDGNLITNPSNDLLNKQIYGCGCFWLRK